jgi:hypothetical protein
MAKDNRKQSSGNIKLQVSGMMPLRSATILEEKNSSHCGVTVFWKGFWSATAVSRFLGRKFYATPPWLGFLEGFFTSHGRGMTLREEISRHTAVARFSGRKFYPKPPCP